MYGLVVMVFALLALGSVVALTIRATRPASMVECLIIVLVGCLAGLGALAMAHTTDDAVAVYGRTIYCDTSDLIGEDPPSVDVQDRCRAQRQDRERQGWLAAAGAALIAAGAVSVASSVGPLARRRDPDRRLPVPPFGTETSAPTPGHPRDTGG